MALLFIEGIDGFLLAIAAEGKSPHTVVDYRNCLTKAVPLVVGAGLGADDVAGGGGGGAAAFGGGHGLERASCRRP